MVITHEFVKYDITFEFYSIFSTTKKYTQKHINYIFKI